MRYHPSQDIMSVCPAFEDLSALIDGDLPREREGKVRQHLGRCAICRKELEGLAAIKRTVGHAYDSELPSPALRSAVTAGLSKRRRRRTS
jgi:anti-sigma factor RsiW